VQDVVDHSEELRSTKFQEAFRELIPIQALRIQYLFREALLNPMMIGIGITLCGLFVADTGYDSWLGSMWGYLLGIGTSLVAWHLVKLYEENRERNRLKLLARLLFSSEQTHVEAVDVVKKLAEKVAPDTAVHLTELVKNYSKSPADTVSILKREFDQWD
jgi:hypothetical protein